MTNKAVAKQLKLTADLVELTGGNPYRARAYSSGARTLERLEESVLDLLAAGGLEDVKGIGKGLVAEIEEFVATGVMGVTESLLQALPPGLPEVLRVKGLGVKKVRVLWKDAGVTSLDDLEGAAATGRLAELPGFGAKTVQNILASVEELKSYRGLAHLRDAALAALAVRDTLREAGFRCELAGPVRRQCNTVDRVDLVLEGEASDAATALDGMPDLEVGEDRLTATLPLGLPLTVWTTVASAFGTAWWRKTGPDAHLQAFVDTYGEPADHGDEGEIYRAASLDPIPAPLRDDDWFQEAADGTLPTLVQSSDLEGTVHNHTTASDGAHSLREMCDAAQELGLSYYGVGDHSRSLKIANGLSIEDVLAQIEDVQQLNQAYADEGVDFRVFSGSEVDILSDGSMDFPDDVLDQLEVVVASVHTGFRMTEDEATERVVQAVSNPHVRILGHPTGRLLLRREGYPLDHDAVLEACAEHGVAVELNANPWRLDVDWRFVRAATRRGVLVSINPDAHSVEGLADTRWGVASAQKAGLTTEQSLTSKPADAFAAWLDAGGRG